MAFNHTSGDRKSAAGKASKKRANQKAEATACKKRASASDDVPGLAATKKNADKKGKAAKPAASGKRRPGPRTVAAVELRTAESGGLDPFEIAKQTMKGSVPAIVRAMVEKAKKGSCTHAKTLLEMTGAKHMFGEELETQGSGEPWAKLVLEHMEQAEHENTPAEVAAES